jgi:DNA-binding XRE family transcriptional regulator
MNERIKQVRDYFSFSTYKMAEKLGVTSQTVQSVEKGKSAITETMIATYCYRLGLSENWLRTGEGEMFVKEERKSAKEEWMLEMFGELLPSQQEFIMHLIEQVKEKKHLFRADSH